MRQPANTAPARSTGGRSDEADQAWRLVLAAAAAAEQVSQPRRTATFALAENGLRAIAQGDAAALLRWCPDSGWESLLADDDPRRAVCDLYLPICSASAARPITVGHVGQSLDGFIATQAGESHWITGEQNILHMHRLRALCDAVVVGAGTVAADDPQLTTRLVAGPNPLRVVLDPGRRLAADHRVFSDGAVETLYVCARSLTSAGERQFGRAVVVGVDGTADSIDPVEVMQLLRSRGCARVFVEGGGVTVSMFLEAHLLDRLHIAVAPVLIGDGRPAIRFVPPLSLGDCPRPGYRVFRMGGDVLFDCDFRSRRERDDAASTSSSVTRVI
jgi:riboflavin-specific deaminase-like protein